MVGDLEVQHALIDGSHLELKIVDVPQQPNSMDCGFYVMKYIRCVVA